MIYTLDTQQARSADQRGAFIDETGKYLGQFLRAEDITSANKGTRGIGFTFKSNDGRSCRFDVYTEQADGTVLRSGRSQVMALMTCLRLRQIEPRQATVKKWDTTAGSEVDAQVPCYVDLMNKPIGLLLEAEEFEKSDGGIGKRMNLAAVFQADTELMASEILDKKTQPVQLGKVVATLRDRPLKNKPAPQRGGYGGSNGGGNSYGGTSAGAGRAPARAAQRPATGFDDMDDDIPF